MKKLNQYINEALVKKHINVGVIPHREKETVDLALPSGNLWATCNVGADSPEEYGDYFAWGEVGPKNEYTAATYKYFDDDYKPIKYCNNDNMKILEQNDDAAYQENHDFHIPTGDETRELIDCTIKKWVVENGVEGIKFANRKDPSKYIFIPASGYKEYNDIHNEGQVHLWINDLCESDSKKAYQFRLHLNSHDWFAHSRYEGINIRGVKRK